MAVTKLEIIRRAPYAGGQPFGQEGPFEYIEGVVHFAIDPSHPGSAKIADLDLVPTASDSRVHFSADCCIVKPAANSPRGRLVYEVVNRGRKTITYNYNRGSGNALPDGQPDPGDGFLMSHGFTQAWCGWQVDVPTAPAHLKMTAPVAVDRNGQPVQGRSFIQYTPVAPGRAVMLSDRGHKPVPAHSLDDRTAALTVREHPDAPARTIPRRNWQFARDNDGVPVPDPNFLHLSDGFQPGMVYELTYTGSNWPVVGLGFLATRDFVSFLRYGSAAEGNPCAGSIDHAYGFGASMSGRYCREMVYLGLNQDEAGRQVFDGLHIHTGSSRRGEFNIRLGQPSTNIIRAPGNTFPFTYAEQTDPLTGQTGAIQAEQERIGALPKVVATNSGIEYWWSGASLTHTDVAGEKDVEVPENVRIYCMAGSQHMAGSLELTDKDPTGIRTGNLINPLDYTPILRAVLMNLDRWVRQGIAPPASQYPRIADGSAVRRESLEGFFATIPSAKFPKALAARRRLDFGGDRGAPQYPPQEGEPYGLVASAVDADGNEVAGVRLPAVEVPLGTYAGWNVRHADVGGEGNQAVTGMLPGSVIPFPTTRENRTMSGDPRPAIDERYRSKDDYLNKVNMALQSLTARGYVLAQDVPAVMDQAGRCYDLFRNRR